MKDKSIENLSREDLLKIARDKINNHFLTSHKTHEDIMADKKTCGAMIGFIMCYEWLK